MKNNTHTALQDFADENSLHLAYDRLIAAGFQFIRILSPHPREDNKLPQNIESRPYGKFALIAGIIGAILAFVYQYWASVKSYPMIIGGKPPFAWLSYIPVVFETAVLFAGLTIFFVFLNRLKMEHKRLGHLPCPDCYVLLVFCESEEECEQAEQIMEIDE